MRCLLILAASGGVFLACAPLGVALLFTVCLLETRRAYDGPPSRYRWDGLSEPRNAEVPLTEGQEHCDA